MPPALRISGRSLATLVPDLGIEPGPRYAALARAITALILDGRVAISTQLPSERELAAALLISRATVTGAYDVLRSGGYLTSRTGSGSYARVPRRTTSPGSGPARWSGSAAAGNDIIDLSCATLPAPAAELQRAISASQQETALSDGSSGYSPIGLPGLREAVAARFAARGLPTTADQVLITSGALHALDLLLRLLVHPGERVLTELPSYPGALDAIANNLGRALPVPMAPGGGWDVEAMCAALRQSSPRLAYLIPDFQNPTGVLIDEPARRAVLRAARRAGTLVIADESFVELGLTDAVAPSAAIDASVITIGSLSKPVWAGLRIGWIRADAELISRIAGLRASIDAGTSVLDQLVATHLVTELDPIVSARRALIAQRRAAVAEALASHLPQWRYRPPDGGLSLWLELDQPRSTALTMLALSAGVIIAPGPRFGVDGTLERFLRVPFSLPPQQLTAAIGRLAEVWADLAERALGQRLVVA